MKTEPSRLFLHNPFNLFSVSLFPSAMSRQNIIEGRRNVLRLINSGLNFIAVGILTILLKRTKFISTLKSERDIAFLVQKILLIHTLLDLFIQGVAFTVLLMKGESANNFLGSYSRALSALDGLICCMAFVHSINRIRRRGANVHLKTFSTSTKKITPKKLSPNVS